MNLTGNRFQLLSWECVILRVRDDCVECEIYDLTDESKPEEYAEVYIKEFSQFDRDLLQEGAVFYWSIGHKTSKTGQVHRFSALQVRRLPSLSKLQKSEISQMAKHLSELFQNQSE